MWPILTPITPGHSLNSLNINDGWEYYRHLPTTSYTP